MKTSSTETAWEEKSEDITAQILAKRVKKEARLREIAEQSAFSFFIGGSVITRLIWIVGLIAFGVLYFRSEAFSSLGMWPVFALGAFVEACRANRRLDAMIELERITKENYQANKPHHPTARSRSVDMQSRNYNLNPVSDFRPRS